MGCVSTNFCIFTVFLVSENKLLILGLFRRYFLQILPQLKNFFQKSKCAHHPRTRRHLCAKFDFLRPSRSVVGYRLKKKNSHPDTHPAYFAISKPQCFALRNNRPTIKFPDSFRKPPDTQRSLYLPHSTDLSSSSMSSHSLSVTHSLFHSIPKTYLLHKSFPS